MIGRAPRLIEWNDRVITLTPARRSDRPSLIRFFERLSASTLYMRYFVPLIIMSTARIEHELARLFDDNHVTYVGRLAGETDIVVVVEVARLAEGAAEIALTVDDTYQRQGIGRQVFALLPELLAHDNIAQVEATALAENTAIRKLFAVFRPYTTSRSGDAVSYRAALADSAAAPAQKSGYR